MSIIRTAEITCGTFLLSGQSARFPINYQNEDVVYLILADVGEVCGGDISPETPTDVTR